MRGVGFEPTQLAPYAPQTYASASSATRAQKLIFIRGLIIITELPVKASVKRNHLVVAQLGFEPKLDGPEPSVLPLHHRAMPKFRP